jgi:hypothetical protein
MDKVGFIAKYRSSVYRKWFYNRFSHTKKTLFEVMFNGVFGKVVNGVGGKSEWVPN